MSRQRLDAALVSRGLVPTRSRARDLILRGLVTVAGVAAQKPGQEVGDGDVILVEAAEAQRVSRGGVKLEAALDAFGFDPTGVAALDVGASTGGFTQVLLARGAARVVAVDVGRGQLHPGIAADPRVASLEGTDARTLTRAHVGPGIGAVVADLSFISLRAALGPALALAESGAFLAALVKPQFEVGRAGVGKGGIVTDASLREAAVEAIASWLEGEGWQVAGRMVSPIRGGSGNVEHLIGARKRGGSA